MTSVGYLAMELTRSENYVWPVGVQCHRFLWIGSTLTKSSLLQLEFAMHVRDR